MTRALRALGTLLEASVEDRTLRYRLLPYGEAGQTNLGTVTASAGALEVPEGELVANLEHDRTRPVARFVATEDDGGLDAVVRVLPTSAGDDLLVEASEGVRTGISVEIDRPVIRDGALVGGVLSGAGFVVSPAFPSAQLVASDVGDLEGDDDPTDPDTDDDPTDPEETDVPTQTDEQPRATAARVPAGGAGARSRTRDRARPETAEDLFATLAAAYAGGEPDRGLLAALDQGIDADISSAQPPQWLDEVWSMRTHRQRFVPLYAAAPLTSLRGVGWRFAETTVTTDTAGTLATPTVDTYAGYPAQPASSEVKTEAVEWKADRIAGANEFDRAYVDFDTPGFWRGFYREVANDASRKLDAAALTHMLTAANYVAMTDADTIAGGSNGLPAYQVALSLIVTGVAAIQERSTPTFALVGADIWRPLVLTEKQNALEYLSVALGLDPESGVLEQFQLIPSAHATLKGKVLVGAREAHTLYGPKTVRASTIDIANGGVQEGLFAYHKEFTADKYSFALVGSTAGTP